MLPMQCLSAEVDIMDEITNALKIADTAIKTVRIIDVVRKIVIAGAAVGCGVFVVRLFRK